MMALASPTSPEAVETTRILPWEVVREHISPGGYPRVDLVLPGLLTAVKLTSTSFVVRVAPKSQMSSLEGPAPFQPPHHEDEA